MIVTITVIVSHDRHHITKNVWLKYDHIVMYKKYTTPLAN